MTPVFRILGAVKTCEVLPGWYIARNCRRKDRVSGAFFFSGAVHRMSRRVRRAVFAVHFWLAHPEQRHRTNGREPWQVHWEIVAGRGDISSDCPQHRVKSLETLHREWEVGGARLRRKKKEGHVQLSASSGATQPRRRKLTEYGVPNIVPTSSPGSELGRRYIGGSAGRGTPEAAPARQIAPRNDCGIGARRTRRLHESRASQTR